MAIAPIVVVFGKPFFVAFAFVGLGRTGFASSRSGVGENPIAFFTASQIVAREKGFSMISNI